MMRPLKLFLIAGEPSGDLLGADLIAGMRLSTDAPLLLEGIGGQFMSAQGLESRFPMEELSVMGVAEVLPRLGQLLRRIHETADAVVRARPAALITIDSPDFCLRVARAARRHLPDLRVIHYVAPSVWAWRPKRAARMARVVDHVLALLPFEPPYMEAEGMSCDFVGHPVAARPLPDPGRIAAVRQELGLRSDQKLLLVLPGSRQGEVARHAPVFAEVARALRNADPDLAVILPAATSVAEQIARAFPPDPTGWPRILDPRGQSADDAEARKWAIFGAADAALAASGTVSLELAAAGTPQVVAYRTSALTAAIVRRLLRIDTVTLVNLVTETRAIPEFLQDSCSADRIVPALRDLLGDPEAAAQQNAAADRAMALLGRGGDPPGERAARSVLAQIRS